MDTRTLHRTLITLLATFVATSALASARPVLVVDRIPAASAGLRYAVGVEVSAFGSRLRADLYAHGFRIVCQGADEPTRTPL